MNTQDYREHADHFGKTRWRVRFRAEDGDGELATVASGEWSSWALAEAFIEDTQGACEWDEVELESGYWQHWQYDFEDGRVDDAEWIEGEMLWHDRSGGPIIWE